MASTTTVSGVVYCDSIKSIFHTLYVNPMNHSFPQACIQQMNRIYPKLSFSVKMATW